MKTWTPAALICLPMLASTSLGSVVQWDIEKRSSGQRLRRRSEKTSHEGVITNEKSQGGYFATISVGTPGQDLVMQLDTASSDIWVPYSGAPICDSDCSYGSCELISINPENSSTYEMVAEDGFEISYADGSSSDGDYFKDSFQIANTVVHNLTMGLGRDTTISYGLVGVGYANNEAAVSTLGELYANLPIAMKRDGLTNSIAFSLWLNDLDASKGNILFGGIDRGKYTGPLKTIDVLPYDGAYTHFLVSLTSIEATSPSGTDILATSNSSLEVILDSGTTLSFLPNDVVQKMWEEVGAEYQSKFDMAVLPCSHREHPGHFSFTFGGSNGPVINVTMDELVVDLTDGNQPKFSSGAYSGELVCEFGIQNYSTGPYVLGDTFLRSAYVVYDLDNNQVGLAATDFNSSTTDIVEFEKSGTEMPGATSATSSSNETSTVLPTATRLAAAKGFQDGDDSNSSTRPIQPIMMALFLAIISLRAMFMA
ncbi:Eukaryotic aspartyl protease [Geosmithia morbida]|uniref:Eukaryotic aspartyl protease n=1 Tax=Geosmithia morbida TaxID=1094350 RepID=A0A9P5D3G2_9HYPO|nr:Eukaryotic aspartyl protease [Geosmithia morbida]KAF4121760.1 Eukaryotic aspartyl protease [Geosmithia morbida]